MTTFTALTLLRDAAAAQKLGEAMEAMAPEPTGIGVFEMEDGSGLWEVGGYFEAAPDEAALAILSAAFGARDFVISALPEIDWVDKVRRELAPITAGRFFLYGSHDADKVPDGAVPLLVDAAMAFGTGHHGTTLGCLRALDRLMSAGLVARRVADIGCGTAVLAMAAAKVWPDPVLASDIDAVAVDVARANVRLNGLDGQVQCIEATGFAHPDLTAAAPFDLILANILKGPLIAMAPDVASHTRAGGHVILSGILVEQADQVVGIYTSNGFNLAGREDIGDWTTLILTKTP